ncbi:MAG: TetR/AcrR family transcriptional regulator [Rhodothermales bacterium]|nr:TetR/AcrR family transcriptional regulator [Rhodothermales bacterium]
MSRKERERLSRRNAMLRAAQSVFAERGFGPSTLDEIASRAEFGKGTIYNYFPGGKEEILFALLDEFYNGLIQTIETAFDASDGRSESARTRFRAFLVRIFTFLQENGDLFLIAIKEAQRHLFGDDPEKATYFRHQHQRLVTALAEPIRQAMERREIHTMPADAVAHMILGNVNGLYAHVCLQDRYGEKMSSVLGRPEQNAEFMSAMLFDGLSMTD